MATVRFWVNDTLLMSDNSGVFLHCHAGETVYLERKITAYHDGPFCIEAFPMMEFEIVKVSRFLREWITVDAFDEYKEDRHMFLDIHLKKVDD